MSEVAESRKTYPAMYAMLWPALVEECLARGYAAALHGSLAKDMDVIAAPWTAEAVPPAELAEAVAERLGCFYGDHVEGRGPTKKPHGRLCWTLLLSGHAYIDLSVFPPTDSDG